MKRDIAELKYAKKKYFIHKEHLFINMEHISFP